MIIISFSNYAPPSLDDNTRPFSRALMGPKKGPIPNAKLKLFFPIQKDFSQSYNCSALIIAPENKIFMIK